MLKFFVSLVAVSITSVANAQQFWVSIPEQPWRPVYYTPQPIHSIPERGGSTDWQRQLQRKSKPSKAVQCSPLQPGQQAYLSPSGVLWKSTGRKGYGYYFEVTSGRILHGEYDLAEAH